MFVKKPNLYIFFMLLCFLSGNIYSNAPRHQKETEADQKIIELYSTLEKAKPNTMTHRLDLISATFLGQPYVLGALGEGANARYDQYPRHRTDGFDCETYVTTVLALAFGNNKEDFKQRLKQLRYANDETDYLKRNHFTDLDWNLNNAKKGFVRDITLTFKDKNGKPVAKIARALIDKPNWYLHHTEKNVRLGDSSSQTISSQRLEELKSKGAQLSKAWSELPYLPFSALFLADGAPNEALFSQIPDGAIVEIVRPNWDLHEAIGTHLNVSHLGFVFWKEGKLMFRQASSDYKKVVEFSLITYLQEARKNPTIQGINIQVVANKTAYQITVKGRGSASGLSGSGH
jgi:hypothetical protein